MRGAYCSFAAQGTFGRTFFGPIGFWEDLRFPIAEGVLFAKYVGRLDDVTFAGSRAMKGSQSLEMSKSAPSFDIFFERLPLKYRFVDNQDY